MVHFLFIKTPWTFVSTLGDGSGLPDSERALRHRVLKQRVEDFPWEIVCSTAFAQSGSVETCGFVGWETSL
ncbi:MAG: hypothetical protein OEM27_04075 [Nitrospinota bacterium]|nr:hypothetical protein [Nitrospinota bacterium]